ncbi:sensor histidine kinase [Kordiimonas aquimaris]|uniref:sensor histidine kinase n=1 Tax=Kordiimonas aquimaris TaxID=707591 RepID=UPI0021CF42C6|nr:histidine kinase [Kordiimonas aquimaris]
MKLKLEKHQITDKLILVLIWVLSMVLIAFSQEPSYLHPGQYEYPHLHLSEVVYSLERGILAFFVLYYLLPRYFQTGRYFLFALMLLVSFFTVGSFEVGILMPVFFDSTKGSSQWSLHGVYKFALGSLPLLGFMFFVKLTWEYRETQQKLLAINKEKIESELKFLRSQVNPHMLFNALNNIYSHSLTHSDVAPDMLLKLSEFLRYNLYECGDDTVPLDSELLSLENYVVLQEMGLEGRGQVNFSIQGSGKGKSVAPFVMVTLLENCFKHSLNTQEKGILIDINISIKSDMLMLVARNTYDEDKAMDSAGVGIANVRRRLELMYSDKFSLEHNAATDVFEVKLAMPITRSPLLFIDGDE